MATSRSNPPSPIVRARCTVAIPPDAIGRIISYRPAAATAPIAASFYDTLIKQAVMKKRPGSLEPRQRAAGRMGALGALGPIAALIPLPLCAVAAVCACTHDWDRDNPSLHPHPDGALDDGAVNQPDTTAQDATAPPHCPASGGGPALVGVP